MLEKLFGLPIMAAVIAGLFFPYTALSLMPFGFVFLFILMLLSGLTIDWHRIPLVLQRPFELLAGLFFVFLLFPLLQFILAKLLISNSQLQEGVLFGALMPVAFVAPFFTKKLGGDEELTFLIMVFSALLAPVIAPLLLRQFTASSLVIQPLPLIKNMIWLITIPLFGSFLIARYLPSCKKMIAPHLALGNMITLSLLIFILFGAAASRLHTGYTPATDIAALILLAFIQDFGALFLGRFLMSKLFTPPKATALMICLSMRNVAIAAGVLFFYDPRAALAPALVFIAHACLFSFLPIMKNRLHPIYARL